MYTIECFLCRGLISKFNIIALQLLLEFSRILNMDDLVDGTEKFDGLADQVVLLSKLEAKNREKLLQMQAQELSESSIEEGKCTLCNYALLPPFGMQVKIA